MLRITLCLVILTVCMSRDAAPLQAQPNAEAATNAAAAGTTWLVLVDAGNDAESWRTASHFFQAAITQDKWEQALNAVRAPLGKVVSRKPKNTQVTTELPGAPDGHYTILTYNSSFANKEDAVETLTLMQEPSGDWRMAGYFIR